jgi:hypothetical protein
MADESTTAPISVYANNLHYESSAWDLKITFGQVDQSSGSIVVKPNVAVTIPWAQAKLTLYWLRIQVEIMEMQTGKIPIRADLLPPDNTPTEEQENDPEMKKFFEMYKRVRDEFMKTI